jgi:hypothetical protein
MKLPIFHVLSFATLLLIGTDVCMAGTIVYHYDSLNRLTNAVYGVGAQERFVYDPAGNQLRREALNFLNVATISNKTISAWTISTPISLFIHEETEPNLRISVKSSNQELVSSSGFSLSGEGPNRSLRILPNAGKFGTTLITVTLSDGTVATNTAFVLTVLDNHPPLAVNDSAQHAPGAGVKIEIRKLLANDSDPENDVFNMTGLDPTSSQGGNVRFFGPFVVYDPPPGYDGPDSFQYSISDVHGFQASGIVNITVQPPTQAIPITVVSAEALPNGDYRIHFIGIPQTTYFIEASVDLINWFKIGSSTSDNQGKYFFDDPTQAAHRFYRSIFR